MGVHKVKIQFSLDILKFDQSLLCAQWAIFFFRFRDGGGGAKKSSENDQLTGQFQRLFFQIFLKISKKTNSITSSVNQQSV